MTDISVFQPLGAGGRETKASIKVFIIELSNMSKAGARSILLIDTHC